QGLATAYTTGFKWALNRNYNFVFEMDCDFSHDPKQVKDLLTEATQNELVIGSRYIDGIRIINWPFHRLLLSYLASIYTRFITNIPVHDTTGGFKCFSRKALESLNLDNVISKGYIFQLELNYKVWSQGLRVKEVPIIFYERRDGQSKMGGGIVFEALFAVLKLRILNIFGKLN
ncbi:MAG: glycosyltransferase, partial [Bdellovibrionota bacterium]|nr:glycosyltransferase [Bdellovibrionota bacterium]